jgi:hypothetical protein
MNLDPSVQIAIVVALTVIVLAFVFRDRIEELAFGKEGASLKLSKAQEETARQEGRSRAQDERDRSQIDWRKTEDLFWLGNDIMWTKMYAARGQKGEIMQGLMNTLLRLRSLGFSKTFADEKVQQLQTLLTNWPQEHFPRNDILAQLESVKQYVASKAEAYQAEHSPSESHAA